MTQEISLSERDSLDRAKDLKLQSIGSWLAFQEAPGRTRPFATSNIAPQGRRMYKQQANSRARHTLGKCAAVSCVVGLMPGCPQPPHDLPARVRALSSESRASFQGKSYDINYRRQAERCELRPSADRTRCRRWAGQRSFVITAVA